MGRLTCPTCGSGLVPAWTGLKCPLSDECRPLAPREVLRLVDPEPPGRASS